MKPPPFDVATPTDVDAALAVLARCDAKVLAGGQSLLQDLRWRRLAPEVLVDIAGIDELGGVTVDGDDVRIGARVRHVDLERGAVPGPLGDLVAETAGWIAHPPVRSRGTLVGSLGYAHPAAEWCALAVGLGGRVELASVRGRRVLRVDEFLLAPGRTALADDELVTAVFLPRLPAGSRTGVAEHRRTHASFAEVAVVAAVEPSGSARLGLAGVGPTARAVTVSGTPSEAGDQVGGALDGIADPDHRHVARVLTRRLLERIDDRAEAA